MRGLFVVGTDTGVGKTLVSTSLVSRWVREGKRIAVMKPCETGEGDDAAQLIAASGRALDPGLVNPYRFALPAAPLVAARAEGAAIELSRIEAAAQTLATDAERIVVEGAGGLLVPITEEATTAELIVRLRLPVLLVARAALGTLNHTLLTVEALQRRAIPLLGVVLVRTREEGPEEAVSHALLSNSLHLLGLVPFMKNVERLEKCAASIECDAIWRAT